MPKKERPAPLPDAIFRAKLEQHAPADNEAPCIPEEIPVHNTFIQFGSPEEAEPGKQHLSTAPAWIGPSFQSMIQSVVQPPEYPTQEWSSLSAPKKLPSPKKVPVMRYSLSASSARAAGVATTAVVASYDPYGSWPDESTTAAASAVAKTADDASDSEDAEANSTKDTPISAAACAVPDDLPSAGSAQHHEGLCKRCCFFPKGRCLNGKDCEFCHFDHEKRKRKKKKKKGAKKDKEDSDSDGDAESVASNGAEGATGLNAEGSAVGSISMPATASSEAPFYVPELAPPQRRTSSRDFGMDAEVDALPSGSADMLPMDLNLHSLAHLPCQPGMPPTAPPPLPPQSLLVPVDQPQGQMLQSQMEVQASWARNPWDGGHSPIGYGGHPQLPPHSSPTSPTEAYNMFPNPYVLNGGGPAVGAVGGGIPGLSEHPWAVGQAVSPTNMQHQQAHPICNPGAAALDAGGYRPPPR